MSVRIAVEEGRVNRARAMNRYREAYNRYLTEHFRLRWLIDQGVQIVESQTHLNALTAKIQWCDQMASQIELQEAINNGKIEPSTELEFNYLQF